MTSRPVPRVMRRSNCTTRVLYPTKSTAVSVIAVSDRGGRFFLRGRWPQRGYKRYKLDAERHLADTKGYVEDHNWVWPTAEILHYVGLCLLFVVVLVVDLRMLGLGKRLSFEGLYQLLPLGMLGFTLNLATGMMFFVATPKPYTGFVFFLKMMLVVLGAVNILYFMLFDEAWAVGEGVDAPATAKLAAVSAIVIWIAVLICGRLLPVLGNSF